MSRKERERLIVLTSVREGQITLVEGAGRMEVGYRQAKRLWKRFKQSGACGLAHRGRGRPGPRRKPKALRREVMALVRDRYADCGPTYIAERLEREHGLKVDHETLRRWMKEEKLWASRRPERKHRKKRARRERLGQMVQMDGSLHAWFEERGAPCCLMVMIDDATSVQRAMFFEAETSEGAMRTLLGWIRQFGIPRSLYVDRKNTFVAMETAGGRQRPTALGRICQRLGIEIIAAGSPQAKGRVERANKTLQDRLVKDLRYAGISDLVSANQFLKSWMKRHSRQFGKRPADPADAHRSARGLDLKSIFAWEEERMVHEDYTVRHENRWYQLQEGTHTPRPKSKVTVRRRLDGKLKILSGEHRLGFKELDGAPVKTPAPPQASKPRKPYKPAANHLWRGLKKKAKQNRIGTGALPPNPRSLKRLCSSAKDRVCRGPTLGPEEKRRSIELRPSASEPPSRRSGRSPAVPYPPDGPHPK